MKVHKIGRFEVLDKAKCGLVLFMSDSYSEFWRGVTCKNCLRTKPRKGV